jgi:hypothetical protein
MVRRTEADAAQLVSFANALDEEDPVGFSTPARQGPAKVHHFRTRDHVTIAQPRYVRSSGVLQVSRLSALTSRGDQNS